MLRGYTISMTFFCMLRHMAATEDRPRRPEVSAGMAAARQRGVRLGRPPAPVPTSAARAAELRAQGLSLAQIAEALNTEQVPTPSGKGQWGKSNVQYVLARWDNERGDQ
jgi:DNA invertase Pin-like site-specific DNA recombinase